MEPQQRNGFEAMSAYGCKQAAPSYIIITTAATATATAAITIIIIIIT
jgi:hypothetical protein